ncbi:MAG TPA: hypothetical protein VGO62_21465 [Myxococcota bacterium]
MLPLGRAPTVVAMAVACACIGVAAACPSAPVCGNGVVEEGESETTCCADTGCAFGACSNANGPGACVPPWVSSCSGAAVDAGGCSGSYVCSGSSDAPAFDCATCGCDNGASCTDNVCVDAVTRGDEPGSDTIADDLDLDAYTKLYTDFEGQRQPDTLAALAAQMKASMHADSRIDTIVLGADVDADTDLIESAIEPVLALGAPHTLERPACDDLGAAASAGLLPGTFVVAHVDDDKAERVTCPIPATYPSCALPMASDCVVASGRFAETLIVVDMAVALDKIDALMVVRAGFEVPGRVQTVLDQGASHFAVARGLLENASNLTVDGRNAGSYATGDPLVHFVVISAPASAQPRRIESFRALWLEPGTQDFMVQNDILPVDCTYEFADVISVHCETGGASVDATVSASTFQLLDHTTSGP